MAPPKALSAIRRVVAVLLRSPDYVGKLYTTEYLASLLTIVAGVKKNDNITCEIDNDLLVKAFSNQSTDEYILKYNEAFQFEGDSNVLFIKQQ